MDILWIRRIPAQAPAIPPRYHAYHATEGNHAFALCGQVLNLNTVHDVQTTEPAEVCGICRGNRNYPRTTPLIADEDRPAEPLPLQSYFNHLQDLLVDHHLAKEEAEQRKSFHEAHDHEVAIEIVNKALTAEENDLWRHR